MNPHYINEQTNKLHDLSNELYESFYEALGSPMSDDKYIEVGLILQNIQATCDSILDDIKQD